MTLRVWQRVLSVIRLLVALSCAAAVLLVSAGTFTGTALVFLAYVLFAIAVLVWDVLQQPSWRLPGLAIDFLLLFLFVSTETGNSGSWIAAVFFSYVLVSTVMLHKWPVVLGVSVGAVLLLYFGAPAHGSMLLPALMCG